MIKHVWFDLDRTLAIPTRSFDRIHDELCYKAYAEVIKRPITQELRGEYTLLLAKHGSNSGVFRSLGLSSDYWQKQFDKFDYLPFYKPNQKILKTLKKLKSIVPISLFTNVKPKTNTRILAAINVKPEWFTHILTGDDIKERKPALDGFRAMIQKSKLPTKEILYVGDRVDVDIKPARLVGIKTCLMWKKSKEADYSFKHFEDILTLFQVK